MFDFYAHANIQSISDEYKNLRLHIALERADMNKDWNTFKILFQISPDFLINHLQTTEFIFDYNYKNLPKEQINNLFSF